MNDGTKVSSMPLFFMCLGLSLLSLSLLVAKSILAKRVLVMKLPAQIEATTYRIHLLDVAVYVLAWYAMSIGMTLFLKWFLKVWEGGFPFILTMGCVHMGVKAVLSRILTCRNGITIAPLTPRNYWMLAVPIGIFTGADIVLSNKSLTYITVSFFTIVKSGGNVWNLLFSILLGLQKPSWKLVGVVLFICTGIGMASYGTVNFVLIGFIFVLTASILGTLRWVLTQFLMKNMDATSNHTLAVVYYISPVSALLLLPVAIAVDGQGLISSKFTHDLTLFVQASMGVILGGTLSFFLVSVEIELVKKTSALSLGIAGNLKDVLQIVMAMLIFHDQLSLLNVSGLVVATSGLILYSYLKASQRQSSSSHEYAVVQMEDVDVEEEIEPKHVK
ncbi:Drug/Metabolite Transporter (DMT) Superfamily [Thraustotheca clavata]|uniref:Drug/Metabolite Transporter (DMT) Superfamily n=1 Tax=Thraustotheca clavata TaxID=74557 RepID=A0A1W0AAL1_9STRA|nr:Drug/Metabolite Transporter (DMT) Superfamily [Thraustotheca clavata]